MERLPFLKVVQLCFLHELEYIYYEEPLLFETFFPSLERLDLWKTKKLRGWWRMNDDVNEDDHNCSQSHNLSLPPFPPRFSSLTILECPMLTRVPTFANLDKRLEFGSSNMETLEATINMISSKCWIEFPPLSKLKYLLLENIDLDMKKLPEHWVQNLTSLEHLDVMKLSDKKI
ncbi:putative disease resistance protein (TIR-NBS-LRR class) [Trifolium medium]|uniref:Putative disease resistance protein (TIR-NBS-LRR class) n=1 Tax=Trifolium medium TaxID=97028 RepID=A0A392N159_9FABA|nr:putative disease resistance protein (TIR-NBS-LRR class) [Trifolium medium]